MDDKQSQCKRIVEYIREKGCITSLEAYQKLKVTQLAARITDLESAGFVFAKPRLKVDGCRQPVTHYSIIENGVEV
nr:MAG TPA: helix-turn-helix domain protein [Caudoviricetes sp.]